MRLPYLEAAERDFSIFRDVEIFAESTVAADDGTRLTVYEAGDPARPTVLLINALGVSCLFLARLTEFLARDRHVLTWESRGLPDYASVPEDGDISIERQCRDAAQILSAKGRQAEAIVAFCSGSNVAVHALAHGTLAAKRLCIVSPSMEFGAATAKTDYQRTMLPIWENMSKSGPRYAALVRNLIMQNQKPHDGTLASELVHLNNLPFRTSETTRRYAQLQAACLQFDWPSLLARVRVPTLVLHAAEDDMIHEETSAAVAAHLAGASFRIIDDGGHFAIYTSRTLHETIGTFLGEREGAGEAAPAQRVLEREAPR